jgi:hypothetical protein
VLRWNKRNDKERQLGSRLFRCLLIVHVPGGPWPPMVPRSCSAGAQPPETSQKPPHAGVPVCSLLVHSSALPGAGPVETDTGKQTGTAAWRAVTATCRTVGARQGSSSFNAHHGRHILSPGGSQMLDPSYRPPPPFPGQTDRWLRDRDQQPPRAADDVRERGDSGRPGGPL